MKRKLITVLLGMAVAVCAMSMSAFAEGDVARIGETGYPTLQDAVDAVPDGTPTTITLLGDTAGDGVKVPSGKNITFDMAGCTYTIDGDTVGSSGTETNGFQLLRDSSITFTNGVLSSSKAKLLIQNYSNLTLHNMRLDGSNMPAGGYALSNNYGDVNITGNTSVTAPAGGVAFDVYYWPGNGYDRVSVTVDTTGTIAGTIEYASDGTTADVAQKAALKILNGNIEGSLSTKLQDTGIVVSGGSFVDDSFSAYCEDGFTLVQNPDTGKFEPQVKVPGILVNGTYYGTLNEAVAAANAIGGTDPVTIALTEGTFAPSANEQLCITRANVTLVGAGVDKTIIDCGAFTVSGQAGILLQADNVTIQDLKVISAASDGNVSAVKFTAIGDGVNPLPLLSGGTVKNVAIECQNGHGLNIHGVDGMIVDGVTVTGGKCGISIANSPKVNVSNTTAAGAWGSVGMMYKANNASYQNPTKLILGEGNNVNMIYSERPAAAEGGADSLAVAAGNDLVMEVREDGTWGVVPRGEEVTNYVTNGTTNLKYTTVEDALDVAQPGDVLTVTGTMEVSGPVAVEVENVTIKGGTLKADPNFAPKDNVLTVTADNVTLDGVTVDAGKGIENTKYAVHFYCVTGGVMNNCTIINDSYSGVNVNASEVTVNGGTYNMAGSNSVFELANGREHDLKPDPKLTVRGNLNITGVTQLIWTDLVDNELNGQQQIESLPAGTSVSANLVADGRAVAVDGQGRLYLWVGTPEDEDKGGASSSAAAPAATTPVLDSTPKTGSSVVSMLPVLSLGFAVLGLTAKRKLQ